MVELFIWMLKLFIWMLKLSIQIVKLFNWMVNFLELMAHRHNRKILTLQPISVAKKKTLNKKNILVIDMKYTNSFCMITTCI